MTTLAKEYDLSDNGLRRICKLLNVPTPPKGYWVKVEHGQRPPKLKLPAWKGPTSYSLADQSYKQTRMQLLEEDSDWLKRVVAEEKAGEMHWDLRLDLPLHPALAVLEKLITLQRKKWEKKEGHQLAGPPPVLGPSSAPQLNFSSSANFFDSGTLLFYGHPLNVCNVSVASADRALRLLNALCHGVEGRGYKVKNLRNDSAHLEFVLGETVVELRLTEKLTAAWRSDKSIFATDGKIKIKRPTGELRFHVGSTYSAKKIEDSNDLLLERKMSHVIVAVHREVAKERARVVASAKAEEDRKAQEARWAVRMEEAAQKRLLKEAESQRRGDLLLEAQRWQEANQIKTYLDHLEEEGKQSGRDLDGAWLSWARSVVLDLDPMRARILSLGDDKVDEPTPPPQT